MQIAITKKSITEALGRSDPAVENFVCLAMHSVFVDTTQPGKAEANCIVGMGPGKREYCRILLSFSSGVMYADI